MSAANRPAHDIRRSDGSRLRPSTPGVALMADLRASLADGFRNPAPNRASNKSLKLRVTSRLPQFRLYAKDGASPER